MRIVCSGGIAAETRAYSAAVLRLAVCGGLLAVAVAPTIAWSADPPAPGASRLQIDRDRPPPADVTPQSPRTAPLVAPEPIAELPAAVRSALLRSGEIGAVRARRESLRADAVGARSSYYPEIQAYGLTGLDATQTPVPMSRSTGAYNTLPRAEGGASLRWTLFDFGARDSRVDAADASVDGSAASLRGIILKTAFETTAGYFEVLRQRELYNAAVFAHQQHVRFQERVRKSLVEKSTPLSTAALADTRVAQKIAQLAQREVDLRTAEAGFEKMIGQPAGDLVEPRLLTITYSSLDAVLSEAIAASPALAAARKEVEAAARTTKAAHADQFGAVSLELDGAAGHNVAGYDGAGSNFSARMSYRIAVFDGDLRASRRMSAAAKTSEAGSRLIATEHMVQESIAKAWIVHHKAASARRAAEDELVAQVALLALYEKELELGTRPLYQLLDVIDAVANARGRVATTRYAEQLAVYAVAREIGALLDMLDLGDTASDLERTINVDANGLERWWENLRQGQGASSSAAAQPVSWRPTRDPEAARRR